MYLTIIATEIQVAKMIMAIIQIIRNLTIVSKLTISMISQILLLIVVIQITKLARIVQKMVEPAKI